MIASSDDEAERARQLYDEGAAILASLWDDAVSMTRMPEHPEHHSVRGSLAYAWVLMRDASDESLDRAARAIRAVLALQERRPDDAHAGNFRWTLEDEAISDLNGVEFALDSLVSLLLAFEATLAPDLVAEMRDAIALGLEEIDRLDVHLSYTNIALSDICNSILGGQLLADRMDEDNDSFGAEFVERGARRLDDWFAFTAKSGAPHEFNSPTYLGVDIARIALLAEHASDPDIALKARIAEELLWLHVAAHYHPLLAQLGGPHSRAYFDGASGAGGLLKLRLWRMLGDPSLRPTTPYAPRTREEGHTEIATDAIHCPDYLLGLLREKRMPFDVRETTDSVRGLDITTYMTPGYALGTASRTYGVGETPEPWPAFNSTLLYFRTDAAPGYGSLFARYISDDRDQADGAKRREDLWDEGTFVGAQHRNRAIVAYGLTPRMRPARSYKLSVRMFGVDAAAAVYAGDRRITDLLTAIAPGEPIVIETAGAYIAITPLEPTDMGSNAPIELKMMDGVLTLDIYNYRGPAKQFWDYRSLGGPFSKGNVRNAFVLEVAESGDFADLDAFRQHIASATIADSTGNDAVREIAYASAGGSVALRYSLRDMQPLSRAYDGVPYVAPMSRGGAIDGGVAQWIASRDSMLALGDVRLVSDQSPKLLVVDNARGACVFIHPCSQPAPFWIEMPDLVIDCDAFAFGRLEANMEKRTVCVDATGELGPIRLTAGSDFSLLINGVDVSGDMTRVGAGVREFSGLP